MNFRCRIMFSSGRHKNLGVWVLIAMVDQPSWFFLCIHSACQNEVTVHCRRDDSELPAKKKMFETNIFKFFLERTSISNFCCAANQNNPHIYIYIYLSMSRTINSVFYNPVENSSHGHPPYPLPPPPPRNFHSLSVWGIWIFSGITLCQVGVFWFFQGCAL